VWRRWATAAAVVVCLAAPTGSLKAADGLSAAVANPGIAAPAVTPAGGADGASPPPAAVAPAPSAHPSPIAPAAPVGSGSPGPASTPAVPPAPPAVAIAANPAAVNIVTGSGVLAQKLGLPSDSGVFLGGAWVGNGNYLFSGGESPGRASFNNLFVANLTLDLARLAHIPGAQFDVEFLNFAGQPSNREAGTVTGYNGLTGQPPLTRSELYELWWRQSLFDDRVIVRVGKSVPTYDFNNVTRALKTTEQSLAIPAVTSLIYTPIFVNPTILGNLPGYYNSA
jgi:porin